MVLQDEFPGIVGLLLHVLLLRDHIDVDWHSQEHEPSLFVVLGLLANINCNLQEDGIILRVWRGVLSVVRRSVFPCHYMAPHLHFTSIPRFYLILVGFYFKTFSLTR